MVRSGASEGISEICQDKEGTNKGDGVSKGTDWDTVNETVLVREDWDSIEWEMVLEIDSLLLVGQREEEWEKWVWEVAPIGSLKEKIQWKKVWKQWVMSSSVTKGVEE